MAEHIYKNATLSRKKFALVNFYYEQILLNMLKKRYFLTHFAKTKEYVWRNSSQSQFKTSSFIRRQVERIWRAVSTKTMRESVLCYVAI